jgi:hypothetical protein
VQLPAFNKLSADDVTTTFTGCRPSSDVFAEEHRGSRLVEYLGAVLGFTRHRLLAYPLDFKPAFITSKAILACMDASDVESYRPTVNLSMLGYRSCLSAYSCYPDTGSSWLQRFDLLPTQSGYRPGSSTGTAELRMHVI